jgi:hypothetical protein
VEMRMLPVPGIQVSRFDLSNSVDSTRRKQAIDTARSELSERIKNAESSGDTFCSAPTRMNSLLESIPKRESLTLTQEEFFADNQTTLTPAQLKKIQARIDQSLIPSAPGCKKTIKSLDLQTSANALANTGSVWGTPENRFNFESLSSERAQSLAAVVTSHLTARSSSSGGTIEITEAAKEARIDSSGENGDGTSGPCPYEMRNVPGDPGGDSGKKMIVKKPGAEKQFEDKLKEAKFARIDIETVENCPAVKEEEEASGTAAPKRVDYFATKCFQAEISCRAGP